MPRLKTLAAVLMTASLAAGCTDYRVDSSELSADAESSEMTLEAGGAGEVTLRLVADTEALAPEPNSWVRVTVFAARVESLPIVTVAAAAEVVEQEVISIEYVKLTVDDPMSGCFAPEADGLDTSFEPDGSCVVSIPVTLGVVDGVVSLHVTAHFELNFGGNRAPGTLGLTIRE
ncbi:MAG: hypothetical protein V4850_36795 [Myxococcota bacterium]